MPELPEVETVVRDLRREHLVGQIFKTVRVFWPRTVSPHTPRSFIRAVQGQTVTAIERRAKFIILRLADGSALLVHLRMTGQFHFASPGTPRDPHDHITVLLGNDRELRFRDPRKFGRWNWVAHAEKALAHLGPEPLIDPSLTAESFHARLKKVHRILKPLLLDQRFIAGIGNIYADEALWEARLHPCRYSNSLSAQEADALLKAIRRVLQRSIDLGGTSLGNGRANYSRLSGQRGKHQEELQIFRRTGAPCPRCHRPIERMLVGQRSTHYCTACQRIRRSSSCRAVSGRSA